MNDLTELIEARPGPGHNAPPSDIDLLRDLLAGNNAAMVLRCNELLAESLRVPATIEDEETAGKVFDLRKYMHACEKAAESARVAAKEPFLASGRAVDGWFQKIIEPLVVARADLARRATPFLRAKADAERKDREAEERARREEADRLRAEAEDRAAQIRNDAELDRAIEAEKAARQAAADAEQAAKAAAVKPAELSRTRGEVSVTSLVTFMDYRDLDRDKIDLDALRSHLPLEAIEKALRSFIRAGGREIRGAVIFENTKAR